MNVAMVTGRFPLLSQSFIVGKAIALARNGAHVTIVATGRGESQYDLAELTRCENVRVRYLPPRDGPARALSRLPVMVAIAARRSPDDLRRLVRLLRDRHPRPGPFSKHLYRALPFVGERPDVLHFEFAGKASELVVLFDLLPCFKVVSCRGSDIGVQPLANPKAVGLLREVFAKADRVHCVSQDTLRNATLYGLDPSKAFVNHPSIDPDFFQSGEPSAPTASLPVVLSVGRLHWIKGYEYALQAVRMLIDRGVDFRYRIIGEGPSEDSVRFAVRQMGLEGHVELLGGLPRPSVLESLRASDVFLLSSVGEGLSNAVLEAMACGVPVVTTSAGGMAEAVCDGIDGFVVPTRSPELIADRLGRLLLDPALRQRFAASGRARILDAFSIDRQARRFIACYEELLSKPTE